MKIAKMKIAEILPVLGLFLLAGCLPPPQQQHQQMSAHPGYGPPPPSNYQEMIQSDLAPSFMTNVFSGSEPDSYEFYPPVKGYVEDNHVLGTKEAYGWVVCGTLTRRERYSGYPRYDGPILFYALFRDGRIVDSLVGQTTYDHTVPHKLNDDVKKVCSRWVKH
jgi:hypothetical protein